MLSHALKYKFLLYLDIFCDIGFPRSDKLWDQKRVHRRQPSRQTVRRGGRLPVESDADVLRRRHKNRQLHGRRVDIRLQKTAGQVVETLTLRWTQTPKFCTQTRLLILRSFTSRTDPSGTFTWFRYLSEIFEPTTAGVLYRRQSVGLAVPPSHCYSNARIDRRVIQRCRCYY